MLRYISSLSIKTRITGTIFTILLFFFMGVLVIVKNSVEKNTNKLAALTVKDIIYVNESFIIKSLIEDDTWSIYKFLDSIAKINIVKSVGFLDTKGVVVAHTLTSRYAIGTQSVAKDFKNFLQVPISSENTQLGVFVIEINSSYLQMFFQDFKTHITLFILFAGVLSFVLAYFISNGILKRLDILSYNAKKVQEKKFDEIKKIDSKEQDEITQFQNSMETILQQLSESISSEERLKNFYQSILQSLNELIVFTDEDLKIEYSNSHSLKEKIFRDNLFVKDLYKEIREEIVNQKETFVLQQENSGKLYYYYVILKRVEQGYAFSFTDITRLKLLEEQNCFSNSFEIIGEISTGVVHEIKNYLQPVKLLLEQENLDSEDRARILNIFHKTDLLVNRFLETGRPIDKELSQKVSIGDLTQQVLSILSSSLEEKQIAVEVDIEKDLEIFIGFEDLELIITNLIRNAIDASFKKGIIKLKAHQDRETLLLEVIDFGEGINKAQLRDIAKPFFTTKKSGTGIGLYTTYKTVYMHGGFIEVESVYGFTKFVVHFPKEKRSERV